MASTKKPRKKYPEHTSIRVTKKNRSLLDKRKLIPRESHDSVITRLLTFWKGRK